MVQFLSTVCSFSGRKKGFVLILVVSAVLLLIGLFVLDGQANVYFRSTPDRVPNVKDKELISRKHTGSTNLPYDEHATQPRTSTSTARNYNHSGGAYPPRSRYLIYLCDNTTSCYGLGNRQTAIVGVYALSIATGRKFGIRWSFPCELTKFLVPNEVPWDIPVEELQNKTSIELKYYGPGAHLSFTVLFNKQFPQDVVYMRTNHPIVGSLQKSGYYRSRLPKWMLARNVLAIGWLKLMKLTPTLRQALNEKLTMIAQDQRVDIRLQTRLHSSPDCRVACLPVMPLDKQANAVEKCLTHLEAKKADIVPEGYNATIRSFLSQNISMFCTKPNRSEESILSTERIRRLENFDTVNLDLLCLHVRIGKSSTMPRDPVRNSLESTKGLWDFVRPYVNTGRHVYLATDYAKVREEAKAMFGSRVHISQLPITHMAKTSKGVNETMGMKLAMWEQVLLMTSCQTLVISKSSFSGNARIIRKEIKRPGGDLFSFSMGKVSKL